VINFSRIREVISFREILPVNASNCLNEEVMEILYLIDLIEPAYSIYSFLMLDCCSQQEIG